MCRMGTPPEWLSVSTAARPSQPVVVVPSGSADCQMSMASKCERSRVRVADALHDRQLPLLPHRPEALHAGVQADVVVQADDHVLGLAERGPGLVVQVVGVGNDGVEAVVAAGHLQHDQDVVLARRGRLGGPGHELRDHRVQGHQRRALQACGSETAGG